DLARGGSIREAREAIRGVSQEAEARLAALPVPEVSPGGEVAPAEVEPGQRVFVRHLGQAGTVLSPVGAQGLVEVQLPVGKTRVPLEALAPVPAAVPAARPQSEGGITWTAGAGDSLAAEINVIGCSVEEGTGRLRRGIAELLKSHPLVAGFQIASFEEGGSGATIVDLGTREAGDSAPEQPASPRVGTG
ncbi:MAG: Smr/MutS family protein, partial [candidate division NC10 bacterium]|nr:Smr/MutS family protein [candidate division NC10 bacterium]